MKRFRGGCLSAVVFFIVLIICICIVYKMIDVSGNGRGAEMIDTVIDRLGVNRIAGKKADKNKNKTSFGDTAQEVLKDMPDASVIKIEISQDKLMSLLQDQLDGSFPIDLTSLVISSDSTIAVEALMDRDTFIAKAEENESFIEGAQVLLLKLAPKQMSMLCKFSLSYNSSNGELNIDPLELTIEKLKIPVSLIPKALTDKFNIAVNDYIDPYGYTLSAVEFKDGSMYIYIE